MNCWPSCGRDGFDESLLAPAAQSGGRLGLATVAVTGARSCGRESSPSPSGQSPSKSINESSQPNAMRNGGVLRVAVGTGAAQSDAADLTAANIDWESRVLAYQHRHKTGQLARLSIGSQLEKILLAVAGCCRAYSLLEPIVGTRIGRKSFTGGVEFSGSMV